MRYFFGVWVCVCRKYLDDSEIEKEVTKSIAQVISAFLQNIGNKMLFYS